MDDSEGRPVALPDRAVAGERLADRLIAYRAPDTVVVALPRGGVPVGFAIAERLQAPLDILVVRKVGAPTNPEYGLGAVVEGGTRYLDEPRVRAAGYTLRELGPTIARESAEVERRSREYRGGRPSIPLRDRTVIVTDDGVATGGTVVAALRAVRSQGPRRVVLALGVAPPDTVDALRPLADEIVVLIVPPVFFAVGEWYHRFSEVSDSEVQQLLNRAGAFAEGPSRPR